jgi:hypothetical protein
LALSPYPTVGNAVIWSADLKGRFRLLASPAILKEIAGVLRVKFTWRDDRISEYVVDGGAQIIVSHDHHLLQLEVYEDIPIISGRDFRRTLGFR